MVTIWILSDRHIYSSCLPIWYLLSKPLQPSDYLFISFWISFGTFWLPLWYLLISPLFPSDYPFGTFWIPPLYLLITH